MRDYAPLFSPRGESYAKNGSRTTPARVVEHAMGHGQLLASRDTVRELMAKLVAPK